ncbi:CocE/NonD family hydrolase [Defluviimonas sp. WL0002]|uniref:CocE/NonD family hydrolase n=1 Tax=Albidovulum marisflavi TaxID=2984159 RepID=A0ABT2ZCN1_9RHOB|nr:CocE/NonD family hydrolase [Defluviimonas sp. WL0002]MCV2868869.1 CocE/NonD family hydrolase [Defluviimonas sp. WL0002]
MTVQSDYPHAIEEILHTEIPMPDGCRLGARIWRPKDAARNPVPAILEYLPYRKNDFTAARDATMQPYLAGHGYAVVRLDLRGAGDSEGVMADEYLPQEQQDGYDAIEWIARQPWCDGNVGMIGISWGGFNGLQVAALQPPSLKTIITLCSTDDRYADDVHYMGGCVLSEQMTWAAVMFARNTLAPDPANVGDRWRDMWHERLEGSGLWVKNWFEHQTRDDFWKQGSVCEDWSRIKIPVYAVSGWADGYCRAVFRLMEHLQGPKKGLVGPWAHRYPHIGQPDPAMHFLKEELRWWDHWLKGRDTGIMDEPPLRLYIQDSVPPAGWYAERPGRWVAEPSWPSPNIHRTPFHLGADGSLGREKSMKAGPLAHSSPLWVGMGSGKWCGYSNPGDAPVDQRRDDAGSLCFDTAPLQAPMEFAGDANVHLRVSVDRPVAQLAARTCDVDPEGRSTRVSFGVLNLTHRDSDEFPEPLEPGKVYDVVIPMKHVAQQIPEGHRLRLAISTSYFPMIWPAPEKVTVTVHPEGSHLELPLRAPSPLDDTLDPYEPAVTAPPLAREVIAEGENHVRIEEDAATGAHTMTIASGAGKVRILGNDITMEEQGYERHSVSAEDPDSARGTSECVIGLSRGDWHTRSETWTELTVDRDAFMIRAKMIVWEGDTVVAKREWDEKIPRQLV